MEIYIRLPSRNIDTLIALTCRRGAKVTAQLTFTVFEVTLTIGLDKGIERDRRIHRTPVMRNEMLPSFLAFHSAATFF